VSPRRVESACIVLADQQEREALRAGKQSLTGYVWGQAMIKESEIISYLAVTIILSR
jgi:hypothetical protein